MPSVSFLQSTLEVLHVGFARAMEGKSDFEYAESHLLVFPSHGLGFAAFTLQS